MTMPTRSAAAAAAPLRDHRVRGAHQALARGRIMILRQNGGKARTLGPELKSYPRNFSYMHSQRPDSCRAVQRLSFPSRDF